MHPLIPTTTWSLFRHQALIRTAAHRLNRPLSRSTLTHATSRHRAPSSTPSHSHPSTLPPLLPIYLISPLTRPPSTPIRHPEARSSTFAAALVYSVFAGTVPQLWWPNLSTAALTFALLVTSLPSSMSRRSPPCQSWWPLRATIYRLMIAALNAVTPR